MTRSLILIGLLSRGSVNGVDREAANLCGPGLHSHIFSVIHTERMLSVVHLVRLVKIVGDMLYFLSLLRK